MTKAKTPWTPRPRSCAPIAASSTTSRWTRPAAATRSTSRTARCAAGPGACGSPTSPTAGRTCRSKPSSPIDALDTAQPWVALVLPVAARALAREGHAGEILGQLVPQLDRRVQTERRAPLDGDRAVVPGIRQDRLRVHGARQVPPVGVPVVEGIEAEVSRLGGRLNHLRHR